jgi:hypothetical protein
MPTERKILLALFAIALGIRVLYGAGFTAQADLGSHNITRDLNYAREIARGAKWIGEPLSPRSPGYPAVLAAFYLVSVKQMWLVTFLQAVLGALTVVIVYRLGRQMLDVPFATLAALWFAFHARHIQASSIFAREILAILLLLLALFLLVRPFVRMRYAVVSGIVYTALIHVDPQFVVLLPLFLVFMYFKTRHRLLSLQYLFVFFGIVVVATVPWTIRNYVVYDQPLPISMEARRFLRPVKIVATEPGAGLSDIKDRVVTMSRTRLLERNTVEFWRVARFREDKAADGPGESRPTARPDVEPAWAPLHNVASIVNYGVMLPFFLVGIALAVRRRDRAGIMIAATVAAYFLMRAYLGGGEQSRYPIDPLIILLAFYGIAWLFRLIRHRGTAQA